jgi:hypothetical protein
MYKDKKSNESNGLERCPLGTDVGIFGRANALVDTMTAGFIYAAAVGELVAQTEELERMLDTLKADEKELIPTLKADLLAIDAKWVIATTMFGIHA